MNLSGLVAVSGKSGLYKIIGQSKAGFILQNLEDATGRIVVNANARLAALDETTVYGTDEDLTLRQILLDMQAKNPEIAIPDPKSDPAKLREYFITLVPQHDQERVYASDIKKIISWYKLLEVLPLFTEDDPKHPQAEAAEPVAAEAGKQAAASAAPDADKTADTAPKAKSNAKKKSDS